MASVSKPGAVVRAGAACLAALASALTPGPASAGDISVYPVRIELRPDRPAETVVLGSRGGGETRFEVSYQAWTMAEDGRWQYADSEELLVHPLMLTVPPDGTATLRVGSLLPPGPRQQAWRLFIQQLPESRDSDEVQVQLLTRLSLPVFFGTGMESFQPRLDTVNVEAGVLRFDLVNDGDGYLGPGRLNLRLLDAEEAVLETLEVDAGYVLSGARLPLSVPLSAATCPRLRALTVEVPEARLELRAAVSGRERACRP